MQRYLSIDDVMASYPERFYADQARGIEGVVQFVFTGEGGGVYYLEIRDGTLHVGSGDHPAPTVTITASSEDWLAVSNGDTSPMGLLLRGRLKISGSLVAATRLQSLFRPGSER